ncbi:hypothetical protein G51EAM_00655 [Candidatus Nanoperiomorbus periodonticus]|nr:hypothetical protein G51EAM_00655 [Candidatus Nanoperiomorbus periodonticus]
MREECYGEYHQVAYGNGPYGLRPWKGAVIMTKRAESATSSKKHRKEGGLTQEELEALSGILAKMFRSMSARGRQDPFLGEEEAFVEE